MVFVAQVDVDGLDAHDLRGNQHAFQKAMRVALKIASVLERAGLALVDIHRHQARRGLLAHDAPLAPGRKARAAQTAQAGVFHGFDDGFNVSAAAGQRCRQRVAAVGAVGGVVGVAVQLGQAAFSPVRRYKVNSCLRPWYVH